MTNTAKLLIVAFVLIIVGSAGSMLTANASMFSYEERIIENEGITEIAIRTRNESVELMPAVDGVMRVELSGVSMRDLSERLKVEVQGQKITIETAGQRGIFDLDLFAEHLKLTVHLPQRLYESLQADMRNGSFAADLLQINDLQVSTDNGSILLEDFEAAKVRVESDNGSIRLSQVSGDIMASSDNGSLSLSGEDWNRAIEMATHNGSIEIETATEPTNVTFDLRTRNGQITVFGSRDWDSVVGDGDHRVRLTTHNGDIRIERKTGLGR